MHATSAQFLPAEDIFANAATQRLAATCPATSQCSAWPMGKTPFNVGSARFDASGKLCYQFSANRQCTTCSTACRQTTGLGQLIQLAPDIGVRGTVASTTATPVGGPLRMAAPKCLSTVGVVSIVYVAGATDGIIRRKGQGLASACIQYPTGTVWRRIGQLAGGYSSLPGVQACCKPAVAYKPQTASLLIRARGSGPKPATSSVGCQACASIPVSVPTGSISGTACLDVDRSSIYTNGVDEPFEGLVVNLFRVSATTKKFMGCTQTDGKGNYSFSRVVVDAYQLQFVKQDAGPKASFAFARRGASTTPGRSSDVLSDGSTPTFKIAASGSVTFNALVQIVPKAR